MNYLPAHRELPIETLNACFSDTTNSYKFYFFLAILEHLKLTNERNLSFKNLSMSMLSAVWYPLTYYKLSFGKQDSFKNLAGEVEKQVEVDCRPGAASLQQQLKENLSVTAKDKLEKYIVNTLKRWVVFRFIRPFYKSELRGIKDGDVNKYIKANTNKGFVPYDISDEGIILHPLWIEYFQANQQILEGFIYWHIVKFLQKNNPNVIGLSEKLHKPTIRKLDKAKKYWMLYIHRNPVNCVYSNKKLEPHSISMDHFVPWSYIAHDQLWNIIPTTKAINSAKSNSLPSLGSYLKVYTKLQYDFFQFIIASKDGQAIEDYRELFKTNNLNTIGYYSFHKRLEEEINLHCRSAVNLGFSPKFIWKEPIAHSL